MTVDAILELIDESINRGQRTDIGDLTAISGYSRRHLQRIFKTETGMNLGDYIRRRRLTRAALLARLSFRTLSDISYSLGFDSQQSFNREFKKIFKKTPTEYRNSSEWQLSSLTGKIGVGNETYQSKVIIYLEKGDIWGEEIVAYGDIPYTDTSSSVKARLDKIFLSVNNSDNDVWVLSYVKVLTNHKFNYQINSGIGTKNINMEKKFSYQPGFYLESIFETCRGTHTDIINNIYLKVLPENNLNRVEGTDIEIFHHQEGKIICTHLLPVQ
ncbi:helix-turn-helix domain-containing protein [Yersinia enterocolitica]